MQRPLKFRAWYHATKPEYHQGIQTNPDKMLQVGDNSGTKHPLDCCIYFKQGQPVELMQYTGLKDSKGREIYEGDIVRVIETQKWNVWRKEVCHRSIYGPEFIAPVVWNDKQTSFTLAYKWSDTGKIDDHIRILPSETEVIGNIYSNPEVLNEALC